MNTAETIISIIMGVLSSAVFTYALYRYAYYKGFDNAMELVDKMREERLKHDC